MDSNRSDHQPSAIYWERRMAEPKLKGAVVGCRGMGAWHARSIARSREVELVGLCDLDETLARNLAAELAGARPYRDLEAMLAEEAPDVLAIATPNISHAELTLQAVR